MKIPESVKEVHTFYIKNKINTTIDLNTKSIKKAILELVNYKNLTTNMGMASRDFAIQNYSWYKNVLALEEIYKIL